MGSRSPVRLSVGTVVAAIALTAAAAGAAWAVPGSFGTPRHVHKISEDTLSGPAGSEPDTQVEPDIAVDPNDAANLVAVFQQGRFPDGGSVDPGYATSRDGGKTWVDGNLPGLTTAVGGPFDRASDPAVAFGPDGAVYACTLPFDAQDARNGIAVQRSDDGGITWHDPVFAQDEFGHGDDKNWIAVDTFPSSPHFGRVYIAWDRSSRTGQPIVLKYSDDRGVHWSSLITVSNASAFGIGARPVVQPSGDVTMIYENLGSAKVVAQVSHDGGVTWTRQVVVSADRANDPPDMRAGSDLPSAAVDPATGDIYAVWGDTRFRSTTALEDAVLSRSVDGGTTWSRPVRANQDPVGDNLTHTTPAVDANGGFVHVSYLTRALNGSTFDDHVNLRYIVSGDNGHTFSGELTIGPTINLKWSARAGGKFLGDYMGVAATPNAVHLVWCVSTKPPVPETYHQTTWSATVGA